jgi:hypothetical protein
MNIQALAAQAGFIVDRDSQKYQPQCIQATHFLIDEPLAKFMKLVAAAEREACADLCYQLVDNSRELRFAAAIRARSKA